MTNFVNQALRGDPSRRPLPFDDPKLRQPDMTIARDRFAWEPAIPLRDGLTRIIAWVRDALVAAGVS